jgi:alpha-1,3-glucanase-like protein
MTPLPSFAVAGNLNDILPTPVAGELAETAWTSVYVLLVSNIKEGVLTWNGEIYNRPPAIKALVGSDGNITVGGQPIKALANDSGLNVSGIQWRCDIRTGPYKVLAQFWFDAPADGETVNLASVAHVPSTSVNHVQVIGLTDVVADASPQLGGDLDLNGHNVGAATAADLAKLHGAGTLSGNNTGDQDLSALATIAAMTAALLLKQDVSGRGVANGYAPLGADNRIPAAYLPLSAMEYQGVWNASTNSPTLADGTGNQGDVYRVGTAGTRNLGSGAITFDVGDYVIYNGTVWEKSDTTDSVASVAGLVGTITAASLKTALALVKADVGLGNVDNIADNLKAVLSATKLATARNINGVPFDGTANITVRDWITPEQFSAVGNGTTDDTTALNNCFAAAAGKTVYLAAGKTYKHTNILTIGQDYTTIVGPGTLLATDETLSEVLVTGKYVTIDGPTIKLASASTRYDEYEKQKLRVVGDYCTLRNVTIDTSAAAGIYTAASYFCYINVTVKNTKADGFYTNQGSSYGVIIGCTAKDVGDDGFSVVSAAGELCHHITNIGCRAINGGARGFSVVGGQHVQIIGPRVETCQAAGLYIASEGNAYEHTTNVTVSGGVLVNPNQDAATDHGAILIVAWDSRNIQYVDITGVAVRDCRTGAQGNVNVVRYDTATITDIAFSGIPIAGGPSTVANLFQVTQAINRIYFSNVTRNGIPYLNSRSVVSATSAVAGTFGVDEIALIGAGGSYTLPTAVGNPGRYTAKNVDTTSRPVYTTGGQTIDGSSSITLAANTSVDLISDGTNWKVL